MSDQGQHGFLFGEAAGRIQVPLPDLPPGVTAYTVPKAGADEDLPGGRLPKDRKGRIKVTRVDLLPTKSAESLVLPKTLRPQDVVWALRTRTSRRWTGMVSQLGPDAWDAAIDLVRAGLGVVRCVVEGFDYRPHSFRLSEAWAAVAEDHITELTGRPNPNAARDELLELISTVPDLADEHQMLNDMPATATLKVPPHSRTGTPVWSVYEAAVRAACVWIPDHEKGIKHTAKALAGFAFHGTKKWTPERETAFANLIGMPFDAAVKDADVAVLMRGPLQWRVGSVIADASASRPWIGLPAAGLRLLGTLDVSTVHGVLFVENKDTFQAVCSRQEIVDRWLCVWGQGYPSKGLVALLSELSDRPLAAWCDLDADGIGIIANLSDRVGIHVHPVGMEVELWAAGPYRQQSTQNLTRGRTLAAKLAIEGPIPLRSLAAAIAEDGAGREQETLYQQVLPHLAERLRDLE